MLAPWIIVSAVIVMCVIGVCIYFESNKDRKYTYTIILIMYLIITFILVFTIGDHIEVKPSYATICNNWIH